MTSENVKNTPSEGISNTMARELEAMLSNNSDVVNTPYAPSPETQFTPETPTAETIATSGLLAATKTAFSKEARITRAQHRINTVRSIAQTIEDPRGQVSDPITMAQATKKIGWTGIYERTITDRDAEGNVTKHVNPYQPATFSEVSAAKRLSRTKRKQRVLNSKAEWLRKSYPEAGSHDGLSLRSSHSRYMGRVNRQANRLQKRAEKQQDKFNSIAGSSDLRYKFSRWRMDKDVSKRQSKVRKSKDTGPDQTSPARPDTNIVPWDSSGIVSNTMRMLETVDSGLYGGDIPTAEATERSRDSETETQSPHTSVQRQGLQYLAGNSRGLEGSKGNKKDMKDISFTVMSAESFENALVKRGFKPKQAKRAYKELQDAGIIDAEHTPGVGHKVLIGRELLLKLLEDE